MTLPTILASLFAAALSTCCIGALAQAQPAPFAAGDAKRGAALSEKDCVACHARKFDGDANRIYLRPDRKVRSPAQLMAQVRLCNSELGIGYFPEEEEHVAAYLNLTHYQFKP